MGFFIVSIAKSTSKKIGALIRSMKFLSPELDLYLYKSTICPWMEWCCHVWAIVPSCYLELLYNLSTKKNMQDCWSFTCSFSWTLGSSSKFGQLKSFLQVFIPLVDVLQNWLNWFHFLFLVGGLLVILIIAWFFCHHTEMLLGLC